MQSYQQDRIKQKQLPTNFRQKVQSVIQGCPRQKVKWLDENSFSIANSPQVQNHLIQIFDMSFKTFTKFVQMIGCKVNKINSKANQQTTEQMYITLPATKNNQEQDKILKQLIQPQFNSLSIGNGAFQPNYHQLSIEVNIRKPEHEIINLQHENQFKDFFIKNFKSNVQSTNEFLYNAIYKILSTRDNKKMSPCEIIELLTELRDRIFENQRQLQECIQNFQQKLKVLSTEQHSQIHQGDNGQNSNLKSRQYKMDEQSNSMK